VISALYLFDRVLFDQSYYWWILENQFQNSCVEGATLEKSLSCRRSTDFKSSVSAMTPASGATSGGQVEGKYRGESVLELGGDR